MGLVNLVPILLGWVNMLNVIIKVGPTENLKMKRDVPTIQKGQAMVAVHLIVV